jgi:DNA-binding GntR family transcriptional regulator
VPLRPTVDEPGRSLEALERRDGEAVATRMAEYIASAKERIRRIL